MVPIFADEQKEWRRHFSFDLLDNEELFERVITGDEKWCLMGLAGMSVIQQHVTSTVKDSPEIEFQEYIKNYEYNLMKFLVPQGV